MQRWEYEAPMCGNLALQLSPQSNLFSGRIETKVIYSLSFAFVRFQYRRVFQVETYRTESIVIKKEIETPVHHNGVSEGHTNSRRVVKQEMATPHERAFRRRSMSVHAVMQRTLNSNDVSDLSNHVRNLKVSYMKNDKNKRNAFTSNLGKKSSSFSSLLINKHNNKYTMAEAIFHMQKDTPERFHSHSKKQAGPSAVFMKHFQPQHTIPHSPKLFSKTRNRPITVLSREQMEELEIKESKKYKIKALPISNAVLQGISNLAPVERKPVTRPEPFNLTEMKKKPININDNNLERNFHARPMPKRIFERPAELHKKFIPPTVPKSPNITKVLKPQSQQTAKDPQIAPKLTKATKKTIKSLNFPVDIDGHMDHGAVGHSNVPLSQKFTHQPCKPIPFSFDQRDKDREMKKKEKIQKIFEDEKKLREFHANPIPAIVRQKSKTSSPQSPNSVRSNESKNDNKENRCDKNDTAFKARPPTVLFKKPFVPILETRIITGPCQIQLTTEERAKKRQEFDMQIKEKELENEKSRKEREELSKQEEEERIQTLRSQLVHKAAPVRQYQPIVVQPSNIPLTVAKSPNFTHNRQV